MLQTIILQDSFSGTAWKAADWIEEYKTHGKDENRQLMLEELRAYYVDLEADEGPVTIPLGDMQIRFPSKNELWIDEIRMLIVDLFKHDTAVKRLQDRYFDRHDILAMDIEESLKKAIQTVENGIDRYNEYLHVREKLFPDEWDDDEAEGLPGGLAGERGGRLQIDLSKLKPVVVDDLFSEWLRDGELEFIRNNYDVIGNYDKKYPGCFLKKITTGSQNDKI